jgi:hypothetical protein
MTKEELKVWYERRRKTCYHKSKKDYDRNKEKQRLEDESKKYL